MFLNILKRKYLSGFSTIKVVRTVTKVYKAHKRVVKNHNYFYAKLTTKSGKILVNKKSTIKSKVSSKVYKIKTNSKVLLNEYWLKNTN